MVEQKPSKLTTSAGSAGTPKSRFGLKANLKWDLVCIDAANRRTLTSSKVMNYEAIRMTHLNAIAASSTAHLWWRGETFAARWRD